MSDGEADCKLINVAKASLGVGRLVDCTQADDRRMICLVRERPLLYARSNMPVASYYSTVKSLWQEVADEMGWSVADVRRKWSHIRNSYSRHLRNELLGARTCRGRMVSRWYLADECDFLKEHMATDTRPSPYSITPTLVKMDDTQTESATEEVVEVKPYINSPWFALSQSQGGGVGSTYTEDITITTEDSNTSSQNFTPEENCSFFQFFRGIYNDYQELPARKQRLFKRKCLRNLHELLDDEDNDGRAKNNNDLSEGHESDPIDVERPVIVRRND